MTKNFYLSAALLLIAVSQQCHAMETQNISLAKSLATVIDIKEPISVVCLLDSIAVLGKGGCGLYDFSGKEIIKLQNDTIDTDLQKMSAHPNKKTLAVKRCHSIKVYDTTYNTTKEIYNSNLESWSGKPIFNPINDTILIGHSQGIRSLNYKKNSDNVHIPETSIPYPGKMLAFHPTKQEFLFTSNYSQGINIFQIGKDPDIKETKTTCHIHSCQYSPDGSLIVVSTENGYFIYPESDSKNSVSKLGKQFINCGTSGIAFHPTGFILATFSLLLQKKLTDVCCINYWNTQTLQRIATTALNEPCVSRSYLNDCIDFSCDGKSIVIALHDKCLVIEVPFEVLSGELYPLSTKNRCIFALWVMQHYLHDSAMMLPHDVMCFLTYIFLKSSKF